jgi:4-hydroxyphenylpyruvate dioxygenase-like putative hemolysin
MVNVVVGRKRTVKVSANGTGGVLDTTVPVTLKNTPVLMPQGAGVNRLDHLTDVVATGEMNGATLVYNADNDKYIVQKLDFADVTGDLDGGTF